MVHEVVREILKQKEAERKRKRGEEEWRFIIPPPKPARWRPAALPPVALVRALGVRHSRPELWDLCRDLEDPLRCYRVLTQRLRDKELRGLFLEAMMSGGDLRTVLGYIERSDKNGLKEYIYSRFR